MEITTLTVGPLQTNCYLLTHPQTLKTIIIDPAEEADFITQEILQKKLKPILILLTHGHFDHVLGSLEIKLNFDIPLAIHPKDLSLYKQAPQSALHWTKQSSAPVPLPDILLSPKKPLPSPFSNLTIIPTPGHTQGGISIYSKEHNFLFSGDTLFKNGIGRTDFSYSDHSQIKKSLKTLLKLPSQTIVYPGHGEPTTIKQAKIFLKDTL